MSRPTLPSLLLLAAAALPATAQDLPLDRFGGCTALKGDPARTKQFFRMEKIGDRYWFVTPENNAFWSLGVTTVQWKDAWGGCCPALQHFFPNPFSNRAKYNDDGAAWSAALHARFRDYGWNTEAAWGIEDFADTAECVRVLDISNEAEDRGVRGTGGAHPFVDVFDARFEAAAERKSSKRLAKIKNSPWVVGSFPDNEIIWEGKTAATGLPDTFIAWPPEAPGKQAWVDLVRKRHADIGGLNGAWGTSFRDWDAVAAATEVPDHPTRPAILEDKIEFMRLIAERYYAIATAAMRKADPNHLVFSDRYALRGGAAEKEGRQRLFHDEIWAAAGRHCDVISVNCYVNPATFERDIGYFSRLFEKAARPICITEWGILSNDSSSKPANAPATQAVRARPYAAYLNTYFDLAVDKDPRDGRKAFPIVGAHWFQCYDEPSLGRPDGERHNFGFFTTQDEPYLTFLGAAASFNRRIYARLIRGRPIDLPPPPEATAGSDPARPQLDWKPIEGAASYTVTCSPLLTTPGDGLSIAATGIKGTSWTPPPVLAQGTWHVSVQAVDASGRPGFFSPPRQLAIGPPPASADLRPFFKFEDLRMWRNRAEDGPGIAVAFPEDKPKFPAEGKRCARVVLTPCSLDRAAGKKNDRTATVAWAWAGPPLDMKGRKFVEFAVRPDRVCTAPPDPTKTATSASGKMYPSTKFVTLRLADTRSGREAVTLLDPGGTLAIGEWKRMKVDVSAAKLDRIDAIEWLIDCADPLTPWDQRITIWLDDFTGLSAEKG